MPSARSKKLDQKYVSRAELDNHERKTLKRLVGQMHSLFRTACEAEFCGSRLWARLQATARRDGRSPLAYTEAVLLK